jgi:cytochrome c5
MNIRLIRLLMLVCCTISPAAAQTAPFPPGPGKDVVEGGCAMCHSLSYIRTNSRFMTPDVWKAEVTKMRTAFGAPIDDDAANEIIAYLVKNFGVPAK